MVTKPIYHYGYFYKEVAKRGRNNAESAFKQWRNNLLLSLEAKAQPNDPLPEVSLNRVVIYEDPCCRR
jgi:hypothetical protein